MRKTILSLLILCSVTMTGCAGNIEITEEENDMVAEYAASLLLKYNRGYDQSLDESYYEKQLQLKQQKLEEEKKAAEDKKNQTVKNDGTNKSVKAGENSNKTVEYTDINSVFDLNGWKVKYAGKEICDSYPKNQDKEIFNLQAANGKKLCVVKFSFKNQSEKKNTLNLESKNLSYQLELGEKVYKPLLTLLLNDMQYLNTDAEADKTLSGYLVFEIPKTQEGKDTAIYISKDSKTAKISLK